MKIDLAEWFRLKGWSDRQLRNAWIATAVVLTVLLFVDLGLHDPLHGIETALFLCGAMMLLVTAYQESRGAYRGSGGERWRLVNRDREPDRFRWNCNGQIFVAILMLLGGAFLQLDSWHVLFRYAR